MCVCVWDHKIHILGNFSANLLSLFEESKLAEKFTTLLWKLENEYTVENEKQKMLETFAYN